MNEHVKITPSHLSRHAIVYVTWHLKVRMRQFARILAFNFKNQVTGILKFPAIMSYLAVLCSPAWLQRGC